MLLLIKLLKKFIRVFNSNAKPWQIGLGTALGILIGFMPLWPSGGSPALLGWCLLLFALLINCHLASMFLFMGIASLLNLVLAAPAVMLGNALEGLARWSADVWVLHASYWSHTGHLGETLFGLALAPLFALLMLRVTRIVRDRWLPKLKERRRLVTAGKLAGNTFLLRCTCWFFGV
jgi:hypothetical protein